MNTSPSVSVPKPSSSSSLSMRPRSRGRAARPVPSTQRRAPLDAFADAPLSRPTTKTPKKPLPAAVVFAALAVVVGVASVATGSIAVVVGLFAVAAAAGAWLPGRLLARVLPFVAVVAVGCAVVVGANEDRTALAVFAAACVFGFGALPRSTVFLAVRGARRAEQARRDAEVLRLVDDARRFRRLGRHSSDDGDDAANPLLNDIGWAVAQRDRLYRLLRLVERSIHDTAVVAVYVVDDAGTGLDLVEQLASIDAANHARLPLGGRGVGKAGLVGLCLTRRAPLRVNDDGETAAAVSAHREMGALPKSALCVPLLARSGVCRGVVVVDRSDAVPFDAKDEAFVTALGEELLEGLAGEELLDAIEADRRRSARVYAATRALAGVTRTRDVIEVAVSSLAGLCDAVAIVDVGADNVGRVLQATGVLSTLQGGTVTGDAFALRALKEGATLPHTALGKAQQRPLLFDGDGVDVSALVDVRVVPLVCHGEPRGVLIVAGPRFNSETVDAVKSLADVVALSLAAAQSFDAVEKQATTDGLTGVLNRRALDRRLDEAVARARRSGQALCVMLTDVDHFKSVNDAWGHGTGDEVLKGVAHCLEREARSTDVVGRLGGEEFVVICEATDLAGALKGAERMRLAIKALTFETGKGPLSVTSSFGVALWAPDESGHAVLERSDQALYKAKQQGRDRVIA